MSNTPLISICIPTYKRCRYLESLLTHLLDHQHELPHSFEIVVSDNASPDGTEAMVRAFEDQLPVRYMRHATNIGGFPNVQFVLQQARGKYVIYLSDDDSLLLDQVGAAVAKMEADPGIAVLYAPWMLHDLVADQPQGQFYTVPQDLRVERNQHKELLSHILEHQIFPEIHIVRREVLERVMPRINEHAFFAFVNAADYLTQGAVLIQQQPFYVAITNYFADEVRDQLGNQEVEHAWDRYRGGLDYMLARARSAGEQFSAEEHLNLQAGIQKMIAVRMSVAIRLRHQAKRDPVDIHMLALRLRGMGYEGCLPVPMPLLASEAALYFMLTDPVLIRGMRQVLVVGRCEEPGLKDFLNGRSLLPIRYAATLPPPDELRNTLVFARDNSGEASRFDSELNVRVIVERELSARFMR